MRKVLVVAGLMSIIGSLFGSRAAADYKPVEMYSGLREMVFSAKSEDLGLKAPPDGPAVWGLVMETGYPEAVMTLVALGDGTVSIYFSNGGGIIGLGEHPGPRQASQLSPPM